MVGVRHWVVFVAAATLLAGCADPADEIDAGMIPDADSPDAANDAGGIDAGSSDAFLADAAPMDAAPMDAQPMDAQPPWIMMSLPGHFLWPRIRSEALG